MEVRLINRMIASLEARQRNWRRLRWLLLLASVMLMAFSFYHLRELNLATNVIEKYPDLMGVLFLSLMPLAMAGTIVWAATEWHRMRFEADFLAIVKALQESGEGHAEQTAPADPARRGSAEP